MADQEEIKKTSDDDEGTAAKPDWKKKKVGDDERLTLRIDALEAEKYQERKNKAPQVKAVKTGKISKKVRQSFEEDEEDDEIEDLALKTLRDLRLGHNDASNGDSTLIDSLSASEKRMLEQNTNLEVLRREENAGRANALEQADKMLRQAGLQKMTTHEQTKQIESAVYNPRELKAKALEKNIEKQTGISGKIEPSAEKNVVKGVKKVRETADNKQTPDIKIKDVEKVSKKDLNENETAELILQKSGQTAKLEDIKARSAYTVKEKPIKQKSDDKEQESNDLKEQVKEKSTKKEQKKTYTAEMKDLLDKTLRNNKVR